MPARQEADRRRPRPPAASYAGLILALIVCGCVEAIKSDEDKDLEAMSPSQLRDHLGELIKLTKKLGLRAANGENFRAVQELTTADPSVNVEVEQVEKSLIEIMGSMTVGFMDGAERVGFDYVAGTPVYFEAYDADNNLLNPGDTGGVTGMGFFGFESGVPIASVIIHDTGATFRVDKVRSHTEHQMEALPFLVRSRAELLPVLSHASFTQAHSASSANSSIVTTGRRW